MPAFGDYFVDQLRFANVFAWRNEVAGMIDAETYSPNTANGWLAILRVIMKAAVAEHELPRNAVDGIKDFDNSLHPT